MEKHLEWKQEFHGKLFIPGSSIHEVKLYDSKNISKNEEISDFLTILKKVTQAGASCMR